MAYLITGNGIWNNSFERMFVESYYLNYSWNSFIFYKRNILMIPLDASRISNKKLHFTMLIFKDIYTKEHYRMLIYL